MGIAALRSCRLSASCGGYGCPRRANGFRSSRGCTPQKRDALPASERRLRSGEGDVILQPWLKTQELDLLASDLCAEWIGALEQLGLTHLSERLDDLAGGSLPTASDRILFGAPSRKRRDK